jgi:hypothetical protein
VLSVSIGLPWTFSDFGVSGSIGKGSVLDPTVTLTNRKITTLDRLRTETWMRWLLWEFGSKDTKALEQTIAAWHELDQRPEGYEASGILTKYLKGPTRPFGSWVPRPDALWVDRAAALWPQTSAWFYMPMWYLLEPESFTADQLLECALLLPERFRESLVALEMSEAEPAGLRLKEVMWEHLIEFTYPIGPWALGATACAMKRAELAGSAQAYRLSGVALIWLLDRHLGLLDPWVGEPLARVRH